MEWLEISKNAEVDINEKASIELEIDEGFDAIKKMESILVEKISEISIEDTCTNETIVKKEIERDVPCWLNSKEGEKVEDSEDENSEIPCWLKEIEVSESVPSPRESELHALEIYGGEEQKSFLGGQEVPLFTPGSTRPDLVVDNHLAIEVKNYNLNSKSEISNLCRELRRQVGERVENLPEGFEQKIVLDVRGRKYTNELVNGVIEKIKERCVDVYQDIPVDIMEV